MSSSRPIMSRFTFATIRRAGTGCDDVILGAERSLLFAVPQREDHGAGRPGASSRRARECRGHRDHGRRPRGVVVGAVVDAPGFVDAIVIEVRADDDHLGRSRASLDDPEDVVHGDGLRHDIGLKRARHRPMLVERTPRRPGGGFRDRRDRKRRIVHRVRKVGRWPIGQKDWTAKRLSLSLV